MLFTYVFNVVTYDFFGQMLHDIALNCYLVAKT